jgi:hypothetical protein
MPILVKSGFDKEVLPGTMQIVRSASLASLMRRSAPHRPHAHIVQADPRSIAALTFRGRRASPCGLHLDAARADSQAL